MKKLLPVTAFAIALSCAALPAIADTERTKTETSERIKQEQEREQAKKWLEQQARENSVQTNPACKETPFYYMMNGGPMECMGRR